MAISADGLAFLKRLEGSSSTVYADSEGLPTIGVGHFLTQGDLLSGTIRIDSQAIAYANGLTEAQITSLFLQDLMPAVHTVALDGAHYLLQREEDALCCLVFNIGLGAYNTSTLRTKLLAGKCADIPVQMQRWVYAGKRIVPGLQRRRNREIHWWMYGTDSEP